MWIIALLLLSSLNLLSQDYKNYKFKSIHIEYISTLGDSAEHGNGSESFWLDDYGKLSYTHTKEYSIDISNNNQLDSSESIIITTPDSLYSADMSEKIGTKQYIGYLVGIGMNYGMAMAPTFSENDTNDFNTMQRFVKDNNGTWFDTDKILGKTCYVYELHGTKYWMYKRIILKTESNFYDIKSVKQAVKIEENITIPQSRFELPINIDFQLIE
ncbi:MAG TPA: hypothetical protein PLE30_09290 [Candidatus Kapabacteria bacterium]|nr:hypothetical protein [Candidatus Kapabacteria bacterium]